MAGLVSIAKLIGRQTNLNSKCFSYCLTRYLSAESSRADKPKKPTTHFLLYFQNVRNEIDKNNPGLKITEKVKIASQMYKDVSEEEKKKINEQSSKLLEEYKRSVQKWQESLTEDDKKDIKSKRVKKSQRKIKRLQRVNNKPKQGANSFTMFCSEQFKLLNVEAMPPQDRLMALRKNVSECAARWKSLPESDKQVYKSIVAEERDRYTKALETWEQSMIGEGKTELVRKGTLKKYQASLRKAQKKEAVAKRKTKKTKKKTVSKKASVKSTSSASKSTKGKKSSATQTTKEAP